MYACVTSLCKKHLWCDRHNISCYILMIRSGWVWLGESRRGGFGRFKHISFGLLHHKQHIVLWGSRGASRWEESTTLFQPCDASQQEHRHSSGENLHLRTFSGAPTPFQTSFFYPTENQGFRRLNYGQSSTDSMCCTTKTVTGSYSLLL